MAADANRALIERFYEAFGRCNGAAMTACYATDAHFRDPAFGDLDGEEVGAMWRMLTGRATDLEIELREHEADEETGSAHWIARYTFSTGRPVVNDIQGDLPLRRRPDRRPRRRVRLPPLGQARRSARAATWSLRCRRCARRPAGKRAGSSRSSSSPSAPSPLRRRVCIWVRIADTDANSIAASVWMASSRHANICSYAVG